MQSFVINGFASVTEGGAGDFEERRIAVADIGAVGVVEPNKLLDELGF